MNFRYSTLVAVIFLLLATPTAAQAKQFTKLLQLGQVVPGNDQPVTDIVEPTIGADGQVAVLLTTKPVQIDPGPPGSTPLPTTQTFKGIYAIAKNGQVQFLEGGLSTLGFGGANRQEFSAPSISEGKIAYLKINQSGGRGGVSLRLAQLQVAVPGNIKTILPIELSRATAESGRSNLVFVNGKAYFFDDTAIQTGVVGTIDTRAAQPTVKILSTDVNNRAIRASANLLLVSGSGIPPSAALSESMGDANFRPLQLPASGSIGNGFSASRDNIAVADSFSPVISVRFGKQGKFSVLPVPSNSDVRRVFNPSISDRRVIYQAIGPLALEPMSTNFVPTTENIYLSKNGQAGISLIAKNDRLDGKTVSRVTLADNGRTIAGNSAVFTASFTDGTTALYRVDF